MLHTMSVSAHDVAAALRERLPGLPTKKLHKLLYYCQGHHLAAFGEPLFRETISAWDMGPVVGELWHAEKEGAEQAAPRAVLDEAALNTVGYVVSRYGRLSGNDLERLTHTETPWRLADSTRGAGNSAKIKAEWMQDYFATAYDADEEPVGYASEVADWLRGAEERLSAPAAPDDVNELRARLGAG